MTDSMVAEDHDHCPFECEHPQAFVDDGERFCGRCWFVEGVKTRMVLCTPEVCPGRMVVE